MYVCMSVYLFVCLSVLFCSVLFSSVLFCSVVLCCVMVWYGMVCMFCSVLVWSGLFCCVMLLYGMVWYGMVWYVCMPTDSIFGMRDSRNLRPLKSLKAVILNRIVWEVPNLGQHQNHIPSLITSLMDYHQRPWHRFGADMGKNDRGTSPGQGTNDQSDKNHMGNHGVALRLSVNNRGEEKNPKDKRYHWL